MVKAQHINTQGRLKLTSVKNAQDTYDFTIQKSGEDYFEFVTWCKDSDTNPSLGYEGIIYDDILSLLSDSPTALSLTTFAAEKKWKLTSEALDDAAYDIDYDQKLLILNNHNLKLPTFEKSGYFRNAFILSLVKGLRDIWHIECHQPYPKGLSLESVLLLERVRAADCDVIGLLCAWELRSDGTPEVWRHLLGAPEGDIAMRFTHLIEKQPERIFNGTALIEAFYGWFENEIRVSACDHQTLDMIDADLEEARDQKIYGSQKPTINFLENLSCLPNKTCYLRGYGSQIINNPYFSNLDDDINYAYFLQIQRELKAKVIGSVTFRNVDLALRIFPED